MESPVAIRRPSPIAALPWLGEEIRFDFHRGTAIRRGKALDLSRLRVYEYHRGVLTLGAGGTWWAIDLGQYQDRGGSLLANGALSPSAVRLMEELRARAAAAAGPAAGGEEAAEGAGERDLVFGSRVRLDPLGIALGIISTVILIYDLHFHGAFGGGADGWPISWPGIIAFALSLLAAWVGLSLWRRFSWIRIGRDGLERKTPLSLVRHPWSEIREYRQEGIEVELLGPAGRIPLNLEVLHAGGLPLVRRAGRRLSMTLPGRILLALLSSHLPRGGGVPLQSTSAERGRALLWLGAMVTLNSALFFAEGDGSTSDLAQRLESMGARMGNWTQEPWRLFSSLFLHASISHLFFNMLILALLGPWAGRVLGWGRTWIIYFGSGVLGNLFAELLRAPGDRVPSVGASTAILGLLGALLTVTYRFPEQLPLTLRARFRWAIPVTFALTLGMGMAIRVIDNGAHVGGFFAGLLLALVIRPRSVPVSTDGQEPPGSGEGESAR